MIHIPDRWVILRITGKEGEPIDKLYATWYGGYLVGEEWRLNSGIENIVEEADYYLFYGYSGSCYKCRKENEGVAGLHNKGILNTIMKTITESGGAVEIISKKVSTEI